MNGISPYYLQQQRLWLCFLQHSSNDLTLYVLLILGVILELNVVLNKHCGCHLRPLRLWRLPSQICRVLGSAHAQYGNHIGVDRVIHWPVVLIRTHHVCKSDTMTAINACSLCEY